MTPRTLLNRSRTFTGSDTTFLSGDSIEIDQSVNYEVVRQRVFFDDVELVTLHRERGIAFIIVTAAWGVLWTAMAIFLTAINVDTWPVALPLFLIGFPAIVACLIRLAIGRDVVTVFGRRTKAALRFGVFRKRRARDVYGQICAAVRRAQSRARADVNRAESAAPPLPPDVPLPPPAQ